MAIIPDVISNYLDKGYVDRVIITGMDASGKTTMIKQLTGKYKYIKYSTIETPIQEWELSDYQVFDRHQLIESYVYTEHKDDPIFRNAYMNHIERTIKLKFPKTLFVFYMHGMFLELTQQPDYVLNNLKRSYMRYYEVIQKLDEMNQPMIVITRDSFYLKNGIYDFNITKN